ncbi:MAG: adenine phosphoribosyltransferase, partial [Mycobacteriales bacterium]
RPAGAQEGRPARRQQAQEAVTLSSPRGEETAAIARQLIRDVPDFPTPGVMFKDMTPLFADGAAMRRVIDWFVDGQPDGFDIVAGIEARGLVLAGGIAQATGVGLIPVRKSGKLPRSTLSESYALEYGEATLEIHTDAVAAGTRVLIVDDVLATGGTIEATLALMQRAGAKVAGVAVVLELGFLGGRERLAPLAVEALVRA